MWEVGVSSRNGVTLLVKHGSAAASAVLSLSFYLPPCNVLALAFFLLHAEANPAGRKANKRLSKSMQRCITSSNDTSWKMCTSPEDGTQG